MRKIIATIAAIGIIYWSGCTKDAVVPETVDNSCYPPEIATIMVNKCATAGCHNTTSKAGASELDLSSWEKMFEGNNIGAVTIPYSPDYSTVFTFTNTFSDLGITSQLPKMPLYTDLLTKDEVTTLKNWINNGAPNCEGKVRWPQQADRKKFYVINQACDNMYIFDLNTRLAMTVKEVGAVPGASPPESPHQIKFTPDGKYYLIAFLGNAPGGPVGVPDVFVERYRASDDAFVDRVNLSNGTGGSWGTIAISHNSKRAYSIDWSSQGRIAVINLENFPITGVTTTNIQVGDFSYPHGITVSPNDQYLYITGQSGHSFWKVDTAEIFSPEAYSLQVGINPTPVSASPALNPHEVLFNPTGSKYYFTCENSNEVRVFDATTDTYLSSIPVGGFPQEMAFSTTHPYLFVTCMRDNLDPLGRLGSVAVINYQTDQLITTVFTGVKPHGLTVDDHSGLVLVANTNQGGNSHHVGICGGANGNVTAIDMNTLQLLPGFKPEVSVNPYGVAVRPY